MWILNDWPLKGWKVVSDQHRLERPRLQPWNGSKVKGWTKISSTHGSVGRPKSHACDIRIFEDITINIILWRWRFGWTSPTSTLFISARCLCLVDNKWVDNDRNRLRIGIGCRLACYCSREELSLEITSHEIGWTTSVKIDPLIRVKISEMHEKWSCQELSWETEFQFNYKGRIFTHINSLHDIIIN